MPVRPSSPVLSDNQPSKRHRVDTPTEQNSHQLTDDPLLASDHIRTRRQAIPGRATICNAADSLHFAKNRSLVYTFVDMFDTVVDDLGRLTSCILRCGICQKGNGWKWMHKGRTKGSTSNIISHMKEKHELIWRNACLIDGATHLLPQLDVQTEISQSDGLTAFNTDELFCRLTRWIVASNQPFSEVKNEEFQDILTYLKPALEGHLLKAEAIRDRIFGHAKVMRESMKQHLNLVPGLMAVACDAWTSSNRIAFLAITGSWITHDWRLEECLLDFVELHGAHDGQNMANAVTGAMSDLGVVEKLLALVSDSASNNGTLVRHLSTSLERSSSVLRWNGENGHIRCLSHVIHLAVMSLLHAVAAVPPSTDLRDFHPSDQQLTAEDAERTVADNNQEANEDDDSTNADLGVDLASAFDKIRKIAKLVRSSPQRMELFHAAAESIEDYHERKAAESNKTYRKKTVKNLILDIVTRWNSTFYMLERALEFSEAIDFLTRHPKVKVFHRYALSKQDWEVVSQICSWLKFFRSASTMMAAERYPTLSLSLRIYSILIAYVSNLEKSAAPGKSPLLSGLQACRRKLHDFFDKSTHDSKYYFFATVLDPRYKGTLFASHQSHTSELFSEDWIIECTKFLHDTCNQFYSGASHDNRQPIVLTEALHPTQSDDDDEFTRAWKQQLPNQVTTVPGFASSLVELREYLKEPVTTMPPLDWWRLNAYRFPRLAAMARDFLCIPGTSVAVERVFSTGRDVISLRRASLSAETIRVLMNYRAGIMLEKKIRGAAAST